MSFYIRKAFDTVNHEILIKKLYLYGIKGTALNWFKSYLENGKQFCKINLSVSHLNTVKCGVPQGSNLGLLLSLLYINDLPTCLERSQAAIYADDTNVSVQGETVIDLETRLNGELEKVNAWLIANKLTLNVGKTGYMLIGTRQKISQIIDNPLIVVGEERVK